MTQTIQPEVTATPDAKVKVVTWKGIKPDYQCAPYPVQDSVEKSAHIVGSFDGEVAVEFLASNDGVNYNEIFDHDNSVLSVPRAGVVRILPMTRFLAPSLKGGNAQTSIDVILLVRSQ